MQAEVRNTLPGEITIFDLYLKIMEVLLTKEEDYIHQLAVRLEAAEVDGHVLNGISDILQSASVDQNMVVSLAHELMATRYDLVDDYIVRECL